MKIIIAYYIPVYFSQVIYFLYDYVYTEVCIFQIAYKNYSLKYKSYY